LKSYLELSGTLRKGGTAMVAFAKEKQAIKQPFSSSSSDICWIILIQEQPLFFGCMLLIFSDKRKADCFAFSKLDRTYSLEETTWKEIVGKYGKRFQGALMDWSGKEKDSCMYYKFKIR
jgi:hypothetical protein